jgi:branched-chain amino acid transport system permease protein
METLLLTFLNGLAYASILFLIAAGFSLTFGVMGVLNIAHGVLCMVGAYIGLQVMARLGLFWMAIIMTVIGMAIFGFLLFYFLIRHRIDNISAHAVMTIGIEFILINTVLWVWGPYPKMGKAPEVLTGALEIGNLSFPIYRLFVVGVGLLVLGLLWFMQDRTRIGAIIRAGFDNREMTRGLGINYGLVGTVVFVLGIALAGVAGFLATPILGAYTTMGSGLLLSTFIVVIVGGIGYVQGTMLGALLVGLIDTFGKAYIPSAALFTSFLVFLAVLVIRPSGLIGRKVF